MENVAHEEMMEATGHMGSIIDDLGVGIMPDASPSLSKRIATVPLKPEVFNSPTEQNAVKGYFRHQKKIPSKLDKGKSMAALLREHRFGVLCILCSFCTERKGKLDFQLIVSR
uniref:Uncharacterized protein n=1 Tax=Magallana gigas TaxID=29159 RepID=A0A8W8HR21_MAGGI